MIPAQDDNLFQEAPGFEQRLSDLQAQIDRLTIALQLWRDGQERATRPDDRLAHFADDVAEVLQEWSAIGERHARAVDALEQQVAAFATAEARLHDESAQRFLTLQRMVQQEWAAARTLQFEPPGSGREQAAALTHACVIAANARAVPMAGDGSASGAEAELQQYFSQVVIEPVPDASPADTVRPPDVPVADVAPAEPEPAALEPEATVPIPVASSATPEPEPLPTPVADAVIVPPAAARSQPVLTAEYLPNDEADALRAELMRRIAEMRVMFRESIEQAIDQNDLQNRATWRLLMAVAVAFVLLVAGGAWWVVGLQRQLSGTLTRLTDVETSAARAQATTASALAEARAEAARLSDAARQAEANTAAMSAVLASPDLVRYALNGLESPAISAQLLWSRARGLVVSAAELPPLADGQAYQVWLLTESDAVSAGPLRVAPDGRGSLISARPLVVSRPVVGVSITREPAAGSASPSGPIVALNRIARTAP